MVCQKERKTDPNLQNKRPLACMCMYSGTPRRLRVRASGIDEPVSSHLWKSIGPPMAGRWCNGMRKGFSLDRGGVGREGRGLWSRSGKSLNARVLEAAGGLRQRGASFETSRAREVGTVLPPSAHKLPSVWASRRDLERNKRGNNGRVWFELVMDSLLIGGRVYVWVQVRESWLAAKWRSRLGQY